MPNTQIQKNESMRLLEENKTEYLYNLEGRKVPFKNIPSKSESVQERTNPTT